MKRVPSVPPNHAASRIDRASVEPTKPSAVKLLRAGRGDSGNRTFGTRRNTGAHDVADKSAEDGRKDCDSAPGHRAVTNAAVRTAARGAFTKSKRAFFQTAASADFLCTANLRICLFVFCVKVDLQVLFLGIKSPNLQCKPVRLGWRHILICRSRAEKAKVV